LATNQKVECSSHSGVTTFSRYMKLKLWQFEYDFDHDDAKIVMPLILLVLGLTLTPLNRLWLWIGGASYYLLYFFLVPFLTSIRKLLSRLHERWHAWRYFKCPYCKSRDVILQGYQGYHSDEAYAYHICNECRATSVLVNDKLIKASR
jgi:hypothetical protein